MSGFLVYDTGSGMSSLLKLMKDRNMDILRAVGSVRADNESIFNTNTVQQGSFVHLSSVAQDVVLEWFRLLVLERVLSSSSNISSFGRGSTSCIREVLEKYLEEYYSLIFSDLIKKDAEYEYGVSYRDGVSYVGNFLFEEINAFRGIVYLYKLQGSNIYSLTNFMILVSLLAIFEELFSRTRNTLGIDEDSKEFREIIEVRGLDSVVGDLKRMVKKIFINADMDDYSLRLVNDFMGVLENNFGIYVSIVEDDEEVHISSKSDDSKGAISPTHYQSTKEETIVNIANSCTKEEMLGYCKGNVIKYISRHEHKGGIQDIEKAIIYLWYMRNVLKDVDVKDKQSELTDLMKADD